MTPRYVEAIHGPEMDALIESAAPARAAIRNMPARREVAELPDYAQRYHAEVDAHALTRKERADLAAGLEREIRDAAGLRAWCYFAWLVAGALFGACCVLAGRIWSQ